MDFNKLTRDEFIAIIQNSGFRLNSIELEPIHGYLEAAVLILFSRIDNQWQVILTRRTDTVNDHKGQVAFPGGAREEQDNSLMETALREAQEEIGILPGDVQVIGQMSPMQTISYYRITPFLGIISHPYHFTAAKDEVARIFFIPLPWIADTQNWSMEWFGGLPDGSRRQVIRYNPYDGEILWGISAMFMQTFIQGLKNNTR